MKIKQGYILNEIGGESVVTREEGELDMMIQLNATGAALWKALETETDLDGLTAVLTANFAVDAEKARASAAAFVEKLKENGLLE